ncbi:pilus assembly protein [bacterium]|nr:pilus assembly protein [bacterium]
MPVYIKKRCGPEKGAAAVEFAIILPLMVILVFGIIEFGLILYNQQVITNASREGARAGIVSQSPRLDDASIRNIVNQYALNRLITFGASNTPVTTITRTGFNFQDDLTVTVTYNYGFLVVPNFITSLPNSLNLTARTVMKYE